MVHVLFRIPNPVLLTPRNRNLFQGFITIPIPVVSNPIHVNPIFEVTKCASTTYRITQVIPHVIVVYRASKAFHDAVFVNVEFGR